MYNTDFLPQMEKYRRELFGVAGIVDPQGAAASAAAMNYFPPLGMKMVPCHEDTNGEWVPDTDASETLEKIASS